MSNLWFREFDKLINSRGNRARFLRQGLLLTGLGGHAFDDVVRNIAQAHGLFKRSLGDRLMDSAVFSLFKGFHAIDMGNRYFTARHETRMEDIVELGVDVDPLGILKKGAGADLVHTEENRVLYFEQQKRKGLQDHQ